jgi:hypothetical protein
MSCSSEENDGLLPPKVPIYLQACEIQQLREIETRSSLKQYTNILHVGCTCHGNTCQIRSVFNLEHCVQGLHIVKSNKSQPSGDIGVRSGLVYRLDAPIDGDQLGEVESSSVGVADQDVSIDGCTSCKCSIEISLIGDQKIIDIVLDGRIDIGRYIANLGSSCSILL